MNASIRHLTLVASPGRCQLVDDPALVGSVEPFVLSYPELVPVLSHAMSAVIDALESCYQVAAVAAQAVLTHLGRSEPSRSR